MAAEGIDVLIPLGSGSRHRNAELRYALRSIDANMTGVRRIWVVGEDPGFLGGDATHVPCAEFQANREARIALKVLWACREIEELSEEFLFANDDHFIVGHCDAPTYPHFYMGELRRSINRNMKTTYQKSLQATEEALREAGAGTKHFDCHTPIRHTRSRFIELEPWWERSRSREAGFVTKSVYANLSGTTGTFMHDLKIVRGFGIEQTKRAVGDRHVFSASDAAFKPGVAALLAERFPNPSRFERR